MREIPEWVGKDDNAAIPARVKLRIWERCGGRCHVTGKKIMPGDAHDYDHIIALCNGGENREFNIALILRDKHKEKTRDDLDEKSKTYRMRAKYLGIYPKSKHKIRSRGFG